MDSADQRPTAGAACRPQRCGNTSRLVTAVCLHQILATGVNIRTVREREREREADVKCFVFEFET